MSDVDEYLTRRVALEVASKEDCVLEAYRDSVGVWTWLTTGGGTALLPFVDWRVQILLSVTVRSRRLRYRHDAGRSSCFWSLSIMGPPESREVVMPDHGKHMKA